MFTEGFGNDMSCAHVFEWHKIFSEGCRMWKIMNALDDFAFLEPKKMQK